MFVCFRSIDVSSKYVLSIFLVALFLAFGGCGDNAPATEKSPTEATKKEVVSDAGQPEPVSDAGIVSDAVAEPIPETNGKDSIDPEHKPQLTTVSGHAFSLNYGCKRLEGAKVCVGESTKRCVTTDKDGAFKFDDIEVGKEVFFVLTKKGNKKIQTGTFVPGPEGIKRVTFQVVPDIIWGIFTQLAKTTPDPKKCQIATTVTMIGKSLYDCRHHGITGATVTIDPPLPKEHGPIYFTERTLPEPKLKETTIDGGAAFVNVPPGVYTLTAHKKGHKFLKVKIHCRADWLVNASPPKGLQAIP